eukprot:scaffold6501_cov323-Prasinococcus_capsulatus_cf.AAC.2
MAGTGVRGGGAHERDLLRFHRVASSLRRTRQVLLRPDGCIWLKLPHSLSSIGGVIIPVGAIVQCTCCRMELGRRLPAAGDTVDISRGCGCCWAFNSSLSQPGPEGNNPPITPGFGCEGELVQEIVEELKVCSAPLVSIAAASVCQGHSRSPLPALV